METAGKPTWGGVSNLQSWLLGSWQVFKKIPPLPSSSFFFPLLVYTMGMGMPSWIIKKIKWFQIYAAPRIVRDSNDWRWLSIAKFWFH